MTTATAATTSRRFASRTLRSVIVLALAAALALGMAAVDAGSAEANSVTSVRSCHVHRNGHPAANLDLKLLQWNGHAFVPIRSGKTAANGCGTWFNVPVGGWYRVELYTVIGRCNPSMTAFHSLTRWQQPPARPGSSSVPTRSTSTASADRRGTGHADRAGATRARPVDVRPRADSTCRSAAARVRSRPLAAPPDVGRTPAPRPCRSVEVVACASCPGTSTP